MRLCLVTREFPPLTEYSGGIGRQFSALATELARQGHDVHVATITSGPGRYEPYAGVHAHLLREARLGGPLSESRVMIRRAIDVDRLLCATSPWDVVYAAEWRGEAVRHAARRSRGAVVTNLASSLAKVHEASRGDGRRSPGGISSRLRSAIQHAIERGQTERSNAIVAPSEAILDWARRQWRVGPIPFQVLPNMIDVAETRRLSAGAPPPGYPAAERPVVYFGRLEPVKGVDVLVRAMVRLWNEGATRRLVLIGHDTNWGGGESMSAQLERLAGPHAERLSFIESQAPERLFPALAAAEAVVLPSRWESFSLAALEAMALGKALVVTSVGGLGEFLEHERNALVVAPGDDLALAREIGRLLGDDALRERLAAEAADGADGFDVDPVTRRHVAFFEQVAGRVG